MPIYSTSGASDGSDTAEAIRGAIRRCQHRTTGDEPTSTEEAAVLVERARNCLGIAELLLDGDNQARYAANYLADAERFADEADRYLSLAIDADDASEHAIAEAHALSVATGEDADGGIALLIDEAVDAANVASGRLRGERSADARDLRKAIKSIREDATRLRVRLGSANPGEKS